MRNPRKHDVYVTRPPACLKVTKPGWGGGGGSGRYTSLSSAKESMVGGRVPCHLLIFK